MAKKRRGNKDDPKPQKKKKMEIDYPEKMEIDCSKKDQIMIEEIFARFPDLTEVILGKLDDRSLVSCREVSKTWQEYVDSQRFFWIRKILKYANPQTKFHCEWKIFLDKTPMKILKIFAKFVWIAPQIESSPLYVAGALGDIDIFNGIKEKTGLNEDSKNNLGYTPFHSAAYNNRLKLCKVIIEKVEDKNPGSYGGETPLHQAASKGHLRVCQLIMGKLQNKNPESKTGVTPLHKAASKGHLSVCQLIIEKGLLWKNKNPRDHDESTPLHEAASSGHVNICQLICEKIAGTGLHHQSSSQPKKVYGINPGNDKGVTPLHLAAKLGHFEVCKFLTLNIQRKNPKDDMGVTPLHFAAKSGHLDVCKLLCSYLEDKNPMDKYGRTPLDNASFNKQWKIVYFLIAENNLN